jgi:hypothetical protein
VLKFLIGIVFSGLLYFPSAYFAFCVIGPDGLAPLPQLILPIFIGIYASSLLALWHLIVGKKWQDRWQAPNLVLAFDILLVFFPGLLIPLVFGFVASTLSDSYIYGAVALALNCIPASIAVSLFALGSFRAPSRHDGLGHDILILIGIGTFLAYLFVASPFLLFPAVLALETVAATALAILRASKLNTSMVLALGAILWELADRYISLVTGYLYLKTLAT